MRDHPAGGEKFLERARVHLARGNAERCRAEVDGGLELARGSGLPAEAGLLVVNAQLEVWRFDPASAVAAARLAAVTARRVGAFVAAAELTLGQALYVAESRKCLAQFRRARRAAADSGESDIEFEAWAAEAAALQIFGRSPDAIKVSEWIHEEAKRRGKHIWADHSRWTIARLGWLAGGHTDAAIREFRRLEGSHLLGLHGPQFIGDLALALADFGDIDTARETVKTAVDAANTLWTVGVTAFYRAEIEWASGRLEGCLREIDGALATDLPRPVELVTRHLRLWAIFEVSGPEWDPKLSRPTTPLLAGVSVDNEAFRLLGEGRLDEAEQAFRLAGAAWHNNLFRAELRSLWAAALVQLQRGDRVGARAALRQLEPRAAAAELISMLTRIRQLERELEHTRQRPSTSRELTQREREVLACVAQGMSSKRIAAALKLSRSTIETHIRASMGKLNAATRFQAVALAGLLPTIEPLELSAAEQLLVGMLEEGATLTEAATTLRISRRTATRRLAPRGALSQRRGHATTITEPSDRLYC